MIATEPTFMALISLLNDIPLPRMGNNAVIIVTNHDRAKDEMGGRMVVLM